MRARWRLETGVGIGPNPETEPDPPARVAGLLNMSLSGKTSISVANPGQCYRIAVYWSNGFPWGVAGVWFELLNVV